LISESNRSHSVRHTTSAFSALVTNTKSSPAMWPMKSFGLPNRWTTYRITSPVCRIADPALDLGLDRIGAEDYMGKPFDAGGQEHDRRLADRRIAADHLGGAI